jgi:hypothetical protein
MGGKHSTTTSKVTIPPEVLARYNAVNARAETAANTPYQAFGKTASDYVAQMNAQQNAGISDINATAGSYQPYMTQATAATQAGMGPAYEGIDNYMSPYIKNVADTTGALMKQQYEQAQSGALGTAAMSGAFGGDRAGIAAANMQQQNQLGYGKTMADIMNQGYTQALGASQADLARQLQGGSQMAQLGAQSQQLGLQGAQAKIAAGTMQQQTEQAGKDAMINQFMQEKGYPFQIAQFLANIAMGTGAASGSTTTTQTPRNWLGFASGGAVEGYASGGVAGPRTYTQQGVGGEGYVPAGDLPVGQLMIANPPEQGQNDKTGEIIKMITMAMGAARGGAIDQRHGYALDGRIIGLPFSTPVTDELRERLRLRPKAEGYDPSFDYRKQQANIDASMAQDRANPSNMGLAGHMYPKALMPGNDIPPLTPRTTPLPVGPEEQWDIPVRSGMKEPGIPFRSGMREPEIAFRGGMREPEMPFRSGMEKPEIPFRSGLVPFESSPAVGGPGTFAAGAMPSQLASMRPQRRPEGLGYQPTMPEGGPATFPTGLMPEGLAPATSPFPPARPAGLAGADVADAAMETLGTTASPETSVDPVSGLKTIQIEPTAYDVPSAQPATLGSETKPVVADPIDFFNTKIIRQESGDNQFDSKGNPLTSSAGAVGVAQVMEGTGPEAAKLAGLEWDRNRWLNDKEYNKALGQAYFLEQYRQFGSLDKAAAAYNAGPGAVASAIDRATALGGSYLDYLPAETQNYVHSTTGMGSAVDTGGVGGGRQDYGNGLRDADMTRQRDGLFSNDKPYDQRNMLGKFFYDPATGKLNPNAVLSLLSGIGSAAQAQTISPLGGILAGIGAGAGTYKDLLKQSADVAATNIENAQNFQTSYLRARELGYAGTPVEYADEINYTGPVSGSGEVGSSPLVGGSSANNFLGAPLDAFGRGMNVPVTLPNSTNEVMAGQVYGYLRALETKLVRDVALGIAKPEMLTQVQQAITAHNGQITLPDGRVVSDPTYQQTKNAALTMDQNRDLTLAFGKTASERTPVLDQQLAELDKQALIFTRFNAGALAAEKANAAAVLNALGFPVPEDSLAAAADAQEAIKIAGRKIINNLSSTAPSQEMNRLSEVIENPNMQPEAVKMILSMQKAEALRERDRYMLRDQWNAENPDEAMNQLAYEQWFATQRPFALYLENAKRDMPIFAGELGSKEKPYTVKNDNDFNNVPPNTYFVDPDGVTRYNQG